MRKPESKFNKVISTTHITSAGAGSDPDSISHAVQQQLQINQAKNSLIRNEIEFRLLCLYIFVSLLKTASHLSNLLSPVASVLVRMDIQLPYNCVESLLSGSLEEQPTSSFLQCRVLGKIISV